MRTPPVSTLDWDPPAAPFHIDGQVSLDSSDWGFVCARTGTGGGYVAKSLGFTRDELFPVNVAELLNSERITDQHFLIRKLHSYGIDAVELREFCETWKSRRFQGFYADVACRYNMYSDFLKRVFPTSKRVLLHRHPLDRLYFIIRNDPTFVPTFDNMFRQCVEYQMLGDARVDWTLRVRYEEFEENPLLALRSITQHFGIPTPETCEKIDIHQRWYMSDDVCRFANELYDRGKSDLITLMDLSRFISEEELRDAIDG